MLLLGHPVVRAMDLLCQGHRRAKGGTTAKNVSGTTAKKCCCNPSKSGGSTVPAHHGDLVYGGGRRSLLIVGLIYALAECATTRGYLEVGLLLYPSPTQSNSSPLKAIEGVGSVRASSTRRTFLLDQQTKYPLSGGRLVSRL